MPSRYSLAAEAMDLKAIVTPKDFSPLTLRTPILVRGTFADPKVAIEKGPLTQKLGTSALLSLANPLAATLFDVESAADLQGLDLARLLAEFECQPAPDWPQALAEVRRSQQGLAVQARLAGQGDHVIHAHGVAMHGGTRLIVAVADVAPIKQAERAREELLAFVSHDLRAPATSIALLAELHLAGRGQLATDELLREVHRLARRTLDLADDFARVAQAVLRPLRTEPVDLALLLAEARADFEPQAAAGGVRLVGSVPEAGRHFTLDRALVLRAVGNLLSNAIKHSPAGTTVRLGARVDPAAGVCVIEVVDQGAGLSVAAMDRLMLAHDGLLPTGAGGVGFGLLFVQRVAQRHAGNLRVQAAEGGGARFELVIGGRSGNP